MQRTEAMFSEVTRLVNVIYGTYTNFLQCSDQSSLCSSFAGRLQIDGLCPFTSS